MFCDYCGNEAEKATGGDIYPGRDDLSGRRLWVCYPCDARVGCHRGTWEPLGTMANAELRRARQNAHSKFDLLWKREFMTRSQAYRWLADHMDLHIDDTHIGRFDLEQCIEVVRASSKKLGEIKSDVHVN